MKKSVFAVSILILLCFTSCHAYISKTETNQTTVQDSLDVISEEEAIKIVSNLILFVE